MMYEPSKETIENIAKEYYDFGVGEPEESFKDSSANNKEYFCGLAKDWSNLPTINKALELYENQPKWQDKPDKTGWWWECYYSKVLSDWISKISPVAINKWADGPTNISIDFEQNEWITIEDYISKSVYKVKFMYASRPEPYKGEE